MNIFFGFKFKSDNNNKIIIIVMNNNNSLNLIYIRDDDKSK